MKRKGTKPRNGPGRHTGLTLLAAIMTIAPATGCSHTYRLGSNGITDLPWAVRSELPREGTVVHIIETDGTGHLVRSAALSADTLYFAHHLATFPAPSLNVDPLADKYHNGYTDGARGTIPLRNIAVIRFRSLRKGFGTMFAAGAVLGCAPALAGEWETVLVTAPVTGVIIGAFIPRRNLVTIQFQQTEADPTAVPPR